MDTFLPHIKEAEYEAMQALSKEQRTILIESIYNEPAWDGKNWKTDE